MADVPARVVVGPVTYDIRCDSEAGKLNRADGNRAHTDSEFAIIRIDPDLAPDIVRTSLMHELFHAMADTTAVRKLPGLSNDDEEHIAHAYGMAMVDLLRRNKDLVYYLIDEG